MVGSVRQRTEEEAQVPSGLTVPIAEKSPLRSAVVRVEVMPEACWFCCRRSQEAKKNVRERPS